MDDEDAYLSEKDRAEARIRRKVLSDSYRWHRMFISRIGILKRKDGRALGADLLPPFY